MSETSITATARMPLPPSSRYELIAKIASGGMASVYLGRLKAAAGVHKLRAIKRAHPHLVEDESFRKVLSEEARLAARINHPNVVSIQDAEETDGELLLVMDYIEGCSLSELLGRLRKANRALDPDVAMRIVLDVAAGLQAAHELKDDAGNELGLVHRDVSPHNIVVGLDGIARLTDFGIAKCVLGVGDAKTATGFLKGKSGYMSPEYIRSNDVDARGDVFALGVVLWEMLAGRRLFTGESDLAAIQKVALEPAPSLTAWGVGPALDQAVARALAKVPSARYPTVRAFVDALTDAMADLGIVADPAKVGALVEEQFGVVLTERRALVRSLTVSTEGTISYKEVETTIALTAPLYAVRTLSGSARRSSWMWGIAGTILLMGVLVASFRPTQRAVVLQSAIHASLSLPFSSAFIFDPQAMAVPSAPVVAPQVASSASTGKAPVVQNARVGSGKTYVRRPNVAPPVAPPAKTAPTIGPNPY